MVDGSSGMDKDEAGWKLVAGDAFRPPPNGKTLAVQIGTGVQVMVTSAVTLLLATLGFLSPAARGALVTTAMIFFVLTSALAGFSCERKAQPCVLLALRACMHGQKDDALAAAHVHTMPQTRPPPPLPEASEAGVGVTLSGV